VWVSEESVYCPLLAVSSLFSCGSPSPQKSEPDEQTGSFEQAVNDPYFQSNVAPSGAWTVPVGRLGQFAPTFPAFPSPVGADDKVSLFFADVNGDQATDLLALNPTTSAVFIYLGINVTGVPTFESNRQRCTCP